MDIAVKKLEEQDKKINELAEEFNNALRNSDNAKMVQQGIYELLKEIKKMQFLAKEMHELSHWLETTSRALEQPAGREVLHLHHVSKGIWAAITLFLILCLEKDNVVTAK